MFDGAELGRQVRRFIITMFNIQRDEIEPGEAVSGQVEIQFPTTTTTEDQNDG